jgi:hypothetical protein
MTFERSNIGSVFALGCCFIFLTACAKAPALMTLRRLGKNQAHIERYLDKQEAQFQKLIEDLKAQKLEKGISKSSFERLYGQPIIDRQWQERGRESIYRHPTNYFTSDKLYVYFDHTRSLSHWTYEPYIKPVSDAHESDR